MDDEVALRHVRDRGVVVAARGVGVESIIIPGRRHVSAPIVALPANRGPPSPAARPPRHRRQHR